MKAFKIWHKKNGDCMLWKYAKSIEDVMAIIKGKKVFKVEEYVFLDYNGSRSQPLKLNKIYTKNFF